MSSSTTTNYYCDNCSKQLKTRYNNLNIVTTKNNSSLEWSRLRVKVEHYHGCHNDGKIDNADLCKECAVELLTDALKRVKNGERASKGVESSEEETWK